jgi:hypothetical protein
MDRGELYSALLKGKFQRELHRSRPAYLIETAQTAQTTSQHLRSLSEIQVCQNRKAELAAYGNIALCRTEAAQSIPSRSAFSGAAPLNAAALMRLPPGAFESVTYKGMLGAPLNLMV